MYEGSLDAKILFVSDFLREKESAAGSVLAGERKDIIINALNSAGILASDYAFTVIHPNTVKNNKISGASRDERIAAQRACKELINQSKANVIVPLGDYALNFITGMDSVAKQHLSILQVKADFGARKAIPFLHPETIQKSYSDVAYTRFGCVRLKEEMMSPDLNIPPRKLLISLDLVFDEQIAYLENIIHKSTEISTDLETGNGQVNTVGFAISPHEAISIESGPSGKTPAQHHKLWSLFKQIWESESIGKIAQNGLFESYWAAMYGIQFNNLSFDTMWAMKFLHPTLERGLDNVARIYTRYPYWKDDHSDWNDVRDWRRHLLYNASDSVGQFAAKVNMQKALEARGISDTFHNFIMPQFPIAHEMQVRGFRLDEGALDYQRRKVLGEIKDLTDSFDKQCEARVGKRINPNSPKQVKEALKAIGLKLPILKGKESTTKASLMKLKNKYPKELLIKEILHLDQLNKRLDEYLNFEYDDDGRVRCSFDLSSDENGVWVGKKNIFDKGFDATRVPQIVKTCIIPDEGKSFVEFRFNQPELRFIAEDAPDYKLKAMLAECHDISKYIAGKLFRKNESMVSYGECNIATQVIKSANEMDAPKQFVEKCFARSGVFYQDAEAKRLIQIYFEEFPGCRKRIEKVTKEMYLKRMLSSNNRQITYYDRINDSLIRRALSFGPESYSNDLVTALAIKLSTIHGVEFITRNKNSILVQVDSGAVFDLVSTDLKTSPLHISVGERWGSLQDV